jgi:hypothetical protein
MIVIPGVISDGMPSNPYEEEEYVIFEGGIAQ